MEGRVPVVLWAAAVVGVVLGHLYGVDAFAVYSVARIPWLVVLEVQTHDNLMMCIWTAGMAAQGALIMVLNTSVVVRVAALAWVALDAYCLFVNAK